jgi:folate-dependent phosphoribosylglycinamide formyltransferase PurN
VRIVVLASSGYSETACAMCVCLAQSGYAPVGALVLRSLNRKTLLRKVGQWGARGALGYAHAKLIRGERRAHIRNPYLEPLLGNGGEVFRSLREVGVAYCFPVATCGDQNSHQSIARLKKWSPDLLIFTGGNILRRQVLDVPRLGVLNAHLGLLPEIRGMSSPEWSLLNDIPVGVAIHKIDEGIDTGPVLQQYELPDAADAKSMDDLRNRLIAFAVAKMGEVVAALNQERISARPQAEVHNDNQFFVMHERLQALAAQRLRKAHVPAIARAVHG